ncbi:hypothetical protein [Kitasatospora sp. NPDC056181]|uniref:hypothetical protein n=1 Tax=Kitasatospora sp. NPDC056181 TaxID=3345737 RepID=UPI0035E2FEEC
MQQTARVSEGGEVNQLGHGTQINGLSGSAAIGLVVAAMSIALAAALAFTMLKSPGNSRSGSPAAYTGKQSAQMSSSAYPGSGQLAGSANGVKVVLSMPREGGLDASKYLPTDEEEREYFNKIGAAAEKPDYSAFAARQHLVPVGSDSYKLTITNASDSEIRVVNIRPVLLQREAPVNEVLYYPCCGAGGEESVVATLNLDDPQPYLAQGMADYFAGHSVPISPGDAFDIFIHAKTLKYYCTYSLDVQYIDSAGNPQHLEVLRPDWRTGNRAPFEVTAMLAVGGTYQREYMPKLPGPTASWRDGYYVRSDNQLVRD